MVDSLKRRDFLKVAAGTAALQTLPLRVRANSAVGKLRTAHIGVGGMGGADLGSIASHSKVEVAALCDVDQGRLEGALSRHPDARTFQDYRELFDQMTDIDAVVVSTPDHTHAPAAMNALNRSLPVYCQKPLTHEVYEARQLRLVAEQKGVPTQMGIQVHSSPPYRRAVRMIQDGVVGKVSEVHAWSGKNWGYDGGPFTGVHEAPQNLNWNVWLGTARMRPYHPRVFHPGQWRKLIDFGTGTLGDMGVHIFDTPYDALDLTEPNWVQTSCRAPTGVGHPEKNIVQYEFPGTEYTTDTLTWKWYDGRFAPPSDLELPEGMSLPGQGSLFIGEEGYMLLPHVGEAQLFPQQKFADYKRPEVEVANHYHQWVDACLDHGATSADFSYSGRLTESLLLGVVANRFPDTRLMWDAKQFQVTNLAAANALLRREYRKGFEVDNL